MRLAIECRSLKAADIISGPNLMQSPLWARYKSLVAGWKPLFFQYYCDSGSGTLLALEKRFEGGFAYVYMPWAPDHPVPEEAQGPFLEALSTAVLPFLPPSTVFIRYDLVWKSPFDVEENADRYDFDGRPPPRVREMRMNFSTSQWNLKKAPTDILPPDTVILRLDDSLQALFSGMKPKTRYNVRLSQKKNVEVSDVSLSNLDAWYRMYEETALRQGLTLHPLSDFEMLFKIGGKEHPAKDADVRLLMAYLRNEPLAGIIICLHPNHAVYLYGASSGLHRNVMAGFGLQWKAVELAKKHGCRYYDLFGISPFYNPAHPMNPLYRFKTGFGGRLVHRRGCWDFPVNHEAYEQMVVQEAAALSSGKGYYT